MNRFRMNPDRPSRNSKTRPSSHVWTSTRFSRTTTTKTTDEAPWNERIAEIREFQTVLSELRLQRCYEGALAPRKQQGEC